MLLFNRKNVISSRFRHGVYDEINIHNDACLDALEHLSYVNDINDIDFEFLTENQFITECDYCGKKMFRDWSKQETREGRVRQKYIDKNAEYPCTDDCCRNCIGTKNKLVFFMEYGTTENIKARETMAKNGKVPTSRQQLYLASLLGAKLNPYFKDVGFVDIVLEDDKVVIEYDGSGHYAGINYGRYTYEEKLQQDYERDLKLRSIGYKIIRIESKYDYLPTDEVILSKISRIKEHLNQSGEEFFKWDIPMSKKDKSYGKLRKITDEDIGRT